jgi:hypothetical protein
MTNINRQEAQVPQGTGRSISVRVGDKPVAVLCPGQTVGQRGAVDVVVTFDTTGSMTNKIDGLVSCATAMVAALAVSNVDWRVTAVPFGDLTVMGDTIDTNVAWCSDMGAAEKMFRTMRRNSGGGNLGESSLEALVASVEKPVRDGVVRVVLLITDEPPLTHALDPTSVVELLRHRDVLCNVISPDEPPYRSFAEATGGTWLQIAAHVDMASLVAAWTDLGARIATRASKVVQIGGSPQRLLQLEAGR